MQGCSKGNERNALGFRAEGLWVHGLRLLFGLRFRVSSLGSGLGIQHLGRCHEFDM